MYTLNEDEMSAVNSEELIFIVFLCMLCVRRLSQMHAGHNVNAKRYKQIEDDLAATESTIQQLEGSSNDNADRYKFLQEMRGYVGDLLECFSEKVRENFSAVCLAVLCLCDL